jgi:hypothetical protein
MKSMRFFAKRALAALCSAMVCIPISREFRDRLDDSEFCPEYKRVHELKGISGKVEVYGIGT